MRIPLGSMLAAGVFVVGVTGSNTLVVGACQGAVDVRALRCEALENPLGIDVVKPRLGWKIRNSDQLSVISNQCSVVRGVRQSAYRILVASSEEWIKQDKGDLWDSGKVASDQSIHVEYKGKPLESRQVCYWKVRVWTSQSDVRDQRSEVRKKEECSRWSDASRWTMGLLTPEAWKAKWIAAEVKGEVDFDGAEWICTPEVKQDQWYPPGTRYFRWKVSLPADARVEDGAVLVTADKSYVLYVNGNRVGGGNNWQTSEKIDITTQLRAGSNLLAIAAINGGAPLSLAGVIGRLAVRLADGRRISSALDGTTLTSVEERGGWETAGFDDSAWKPARVLGKNGMAPWGRLAMPLDGGALPLLRRGFEIAKPVRRATVYVCGLGFYELRLNGSKVGDRELDPGWTNYRKTCHYSVYDVTAQLRQGDNAIGLMLGNGMYNVTGGRYAKFKSSFGRPKCILQMHVEYADGTTSSVISDESWKCAPGPILFSCIFGGEDYDARNEIDGWDRPGFNEATWARVKAVEGPGGLLTTRSAPPIKVMEEFSPVKITQLRPGVFVYDLGQNFSGWLNLSMQGPAGAKVKLTPAELLDNNGRVDQCSAGRPVWFSYTLKGEGVETWHPRFSYSGFRYVQVEGAAPAGATNGVAGVPRITALKGQFLYPDIGVDGKFECSNPDVNRIHDLILAAVKSNYKSVLTDCPHREKLGWLECTHLLAGVFMYNYDCARFYAKIVGDMGEAQLADGLVPNIAPEFTVFAGGFRQSAEWGSAYVIAPWRAYQMYGDLELLREHYEGMKRYVAHLGRQSRDNITAAGLGDWAEIQHEGRAVTSGQLTATGVYYQNIEILRQVAALLGKEEDVQAFAKLGGEVKAAFNAKFFVADKKYYDRNSQAGNAIPLVLGLVAPDQREGVLENIVGDIRGRGNRVTAGDVGFNYVVQALLNGGRSDVLYDLLCQTNGPGYMYQLKMGATSLTESWDSRRNCSQNHCMLGHVDEWFYSGLLGIRAAAPGFREIVIAPQVVGDLTWARGHYDSVYGRIVSEWKREGGNLKMNVVIPANTTATVYVPAKEASAVTEAGRPVIGSASVKCLRIEGGAAVFAVGSGRYQFVTAFGH